MSKVCMLTGTQAELASEIRWVRLTLTTRAIKTVDKRGVESVVAELRAKGIKF